MPTAFVASWGEGKPIIGILGEYALPGLSQQVEATIEAVQRAAGHGCGTISSAFRHLAALALKE